MIPVPAGWRLRPAHGVRTLRGGEVLVGGTPLRILTLSPRGAGLVGGWWAGEPVGDAPDARRLARRLLDAGLADPDPPPQPDSLEDVTIVVPVYGDPDRLARCLAPLGDRAAVIVVDDGSADGAAIAAVAERFGARYVRHPDNRGAGAARNTGLEIANTPVVAFLDADCVPPPDFPAGLVEHLADPAVALVAPRVVSAQRQSAQHLPGAIAAYEHARTAVDMGPRQARVRPYSSVWYVPSAAMVGRRDALGRGFDERLRLGEDVDLVWRLHDAGWQVLYDPGTEVGHEDRVRLAAWYRRRVAYNSSAAPLLRRHPERVPVLFLSPAAAAAWGAALAGVPAPLALGAIRALRLRRTLAGPVPHAASLAARLAAGATVHEGRDLARALIGPWAPFAAAAVWATGDRALARRLVSLVAAMAAWDWVVDRPPLDPLSYGALRVADETSRGVGIWLGCLREHDFRALLARRPPPPGRRS